MLIFSTETAKTLTQEYVCGECWVERSVGCAAFLRQCTSLDAPASSAVYQEIRNKRRYHESALGYIMFFFTHFLRHRMVKMLGIRRNEEASNLFAIRDIYLLSNLEQFLKKLNF